MKNLEIQVRVYILQNNLLGKIRKVKVHFLRLPKATYKNYELDLEKKSKSNKKKKKQKDKKPLLHLYCIKDALELDGCIKQIQKAHKNKTGISDYISLTDLENNISDLKCDLTYQRTDGDIVTKSIPLDNKTNLLSSRDDYKYSYLLWPTTEGDITIYLKCNFSVENLKLKNTQAVEETIKVNNRPSNIVGYDICVDFSTYDLLVKLSLKRFILEKGLVRVDENFDEEIKNIKLN